MLTARQLSTGGDVAAASATPAACTSYLFAPSDEEATVPTN